MSEFTPKDTGEPTDDIGLDVNLQVEAIKMGVEDWSKKMLASDSLFGLVSSKIKMDDSDLVKSLPDFSLKPKMIERDDGQDVYGIRIEQSRNDTTTEGSFGITHAKYIDVIQVNHDTKQAEVMKEFAQGILGRETITDATDDEKQRVTTAGKEFLSATLELFENFREKGVEVAFSPYGELMTVNELNTMSYDKSAN